MDKFRCTAIPVYQPNAMIYVASVSIADLETICRPLTVDREDVMHPEGIENGAFTDDQLHELVRSLDSPRFQQQSAEMLAEERTEPYQRLLREERAQKISKYLEEPEAILPNSIILAVNDDFNEVEIRPSPKCDGFVDIVLTRATTSTTILDGQHRIAAFRYGKSATIKHNFHVIVTFLVGIPFYQQAELFAVINGEQKPVSKSLVLDLLGYKPVGGVSSTELYEGLMAVRRFCSHVTRILNSAPESPWKSQVKMRGIGEGKISQAAVVDYLTPLVQPKKFTQRLKVLPMMFDFYKSGSPAQCAAVLIIYLSAIRAAHPNHWSEGSSLFWKSNGVAIMLRLLHDEICLAGGVNESMNNFSGIKVRWARAPEQRIMNPPTSGGGGIQNEWYEEFRNIMFTSSELETIAKNRETLKEHLLEVGGLV